MKLINDFDSSNEDSKIQYREKSDGLLLLILWIIQAIASTLHGIAMLAILCGDIIFAILTFIAGWIIIIYLKTSRVIKMSKRP